MELNAKNKKRNVLIAVRLNKIEKDALDRLSNSEGIRLSETVRLLLREGLNNRGIASIEWSGFLVSELEDGQRG